MTRGKYIALAVKLFGLASIRGIVKDFNTGYPIGDVRISVRQSEASSNQYGEYQLELPPEDQRKFQTIRAFKEGYEFYEENDIPLQTDGEMPILLKPIR